MYESGREGGGGGVGLGELAPPKIRKPPVFRGIWAAETTELYTEGLKCFKCFNYIVLFM